MGLRLSNYSDLRTRAMAKEGKSTRHSFPAPVGKAIEKRDLFLSRLEKLFKQPRPIPLDKRRRILKEAEAIEGQYLQAIGRPYALKSYTNRVLSRMPVPKR